MAGSYPTPGVYAEDVYLQPASPLSTGVPGFVGFGTATDDVGKPTHEPILLHRAEELANRYTPSAKSYLPDAVAGFFLNGGTRCYVVAAAEPGNTAEPSNQGAALTSAINRLGPLSDLDLVAVPDAVTLPDVDDVLSVQAAVIEHCTSQGNRFAILDPPAGLDSEREAANIPTRLTDWRRQLLFRGVQPANAALYYPWVRVPSPTLTSGRPVPPCGHVAGIFARSDARIGVFKAPANEELLGVLDLEFPVDARTQAILNPAGVNCLRALPGRGLRVWGARTLSSDADWLYINVRRLFLTLMRWIDRNMAWVTYEPNTMRLWNRIRRQLNAYLGQLWQSGALKGASAAQAFFVKCDSETNPPEGREQSCVATEIGLAPAIPAEFVVVRIVHRPGAAQLS